MEMIQALSSFIVNTKYEVLPPKGIELCKRNILDVIGVALAGVNTDVGKIIRDFVRESAGLSASGVIGGHLRTSSPMAALANGTIAHALDYDDVNSTSVAHPSVSLLPAILAVGEERGASGREVIEAYITGYEVEDRLGLCLNPDHYELGWHTTGTLGTFGAMAGVSKILGLDEEQIQTAFGIAASVMGGTRKNFGTMTKPLHAGTSAKNGIIAASLAKKGFTANREIMDGSMGVVALFSPGKNVDSSKMAAMLGHPFAIVDPGTFVKAYPCCGAANAAIDALLHLVRSEGLSKENVKKVECGVFYRIPHVMIYSRPKNGLEAKFSLEYCLAAGILDGRLCLEQFTDESVNAPAVQEVLEKITVYVHDELSTRESLGNRFGEVTIQTNDGRLLKKRIYIPLGSPQNPLSDAQLEEKFRDCTKSVLAGDDINRVIRLIYDLENVDNIDELVDIISFRTT
jgi:2-methylcitrate dehydratase PrpD